MERTPLWVLGCVRSVKMVWNYIKTYSLVFFLVESLPVDRLKREALRCFCFSCRGFAGKRAPMVENGDGFLTENLGVADL